MICRHSSRKTKKWRGIFSSVLVLTTLVSGLEVRSTARPTTTTGIQKLRIEKLYKSVLALDIARDSDLAAVALSDLSVRIWNLKSGTVIHEFRFAEPLTEQHLKLDVEVEPMFARFVPSGQTLAVGFLNAIHLYDVSTWEEESVLRVEGEDKLRPGISATSKRPELKPRTAEQAQAQSKEPQKDINQTMREWVAKRHQGDGRTRLRDFSFTKDGSFILASYCRGACWAWPGATWNAVPSGDDLVRLWDIQSKRILWEKLYDPKGTMARLTPLPDGHRFAAVDAQLGHCAVAVCGLDEGRTLWSHPLGSCVQAPFIAMVPNGESLVTNRIQEANRRNKKSKLWQMAAIYSTTNGSKEALLSLSDGVREGDVSADGRWLVTTTWEGRKFQIWDIQAKRTVFSEGVKDKGKALRLDRVRLSPDGRWLVVGSDSSGDLAVYQFN
jgi:WD40 repeat protein